MTSRNVQLVLLCEDAQHETFVRRFLKKVGWSTRRLRVEKASAGAGEQFVRERYPVELFAYRRKRGQVGQALLVMTDGDAVGPAGRMQKLDAECDSQGCDRRQPDERVPVFIPTWNIETWLAYLDGVEVDETCGEYPYLKRERDCQRHVAALVEMCRTGQLREPAPQSLQAACREYQERLQTDAG